MTIGRYSVIGGLVVCIATAVLVAYGYRPFWSPNGEKGSEGLHHPVLPRSAKARAHLYFSDVDHSFLRAEVRTLALSEGMAQRTRQIVEALVAGPEGPLTPTIPAGTRLLAVYLADHGTVYLDFNRAITENHPGGTLSELMTIFSLVNTLALNISEVKAVKILIGGREAETLAGHVDIRFPFRPNVLMIRKPLS
ncbi:MAG: GerMN domain-containing protein [Thermodesulfobacteriota bacterium]|nr:GerMN domain-containing protein [Thermodesulfobacteriota bacterium]